MRFSGTAYHELRVTAAAENDELLREAQRARILTSTRLIKVHVVKRVGLSPPSPNHLREGPKNHLRISTGAS